MFSVKRFNKSYKLISALCWVLPVTIIPATAGAGGGDVRKSAVEKAVALPKSQLSAKENAKFLLNQQAEDSLRKGQYAQVVEYTTKAIGQDADNLQAYCMRAGAYEHLGEVDKASADKTKVIALQQKVSEENSRKQIATYTDAIKADGKNFRDYVTRAAAYLNLNMYQEAIADCDRAIELDPNNKTAYFTRMGAHLGLHQNKEATNDRRHFENLNGTDKERLSQSAVADYGTILVQHPDDITALNNRANAFFQLGRWKEAIEDCDKWLKLQPHAAEAERLRLRCQQEIIKAGKVKAHKTHGHKANSD